MNILFYILECSFCFLGPQTIIYLSNVYINAERCPSVRLSGAETPGTGKNSHGTGNIPTKFPQNGETFPRNGKNSHKVPQNGGKIPTGRRKIPTVRGKIPTGKGIFPQGRENSQRGGQIPTGRGKFPRRRENSNEVRKIPKNIPQTGDMNHCQLPVLLTGCLAEQQSARVLSVEVTVTCEHQVSCFRPTLPLLLYFNTHNMTWITVNYLSSWLCVWLSSSLPECCLWMWLWHVSAR